MSTYDGVTYLAPPPHGVTPNADASFHATRLILVSAIFFPLAVVSTGSRLYSRIAIVGELCKDDFLMTAALLCSTVMLACSLNMLNWGLGKHVWDVPLTPDFYPKFALNNLLAAIFFCIATGFAKGSILLFYLRIFPTKAIHWTVWLLFAFTISYSVASGLVNIFSCKPIRGSWQLEAASTAKCINRPVFYFCQAGLGIFTDIATVAVPLPVLRSLRLPKKQKYGVALLLTVGAFVCIVSIIRLQSLYVLLKGTDLTFETVTALMWCVLELNLSIFGGNIPAVKPFLQRLFPRLFGSTLSATPLSDYSGSRRGWSKNRDNTTGSASHTSSGKNRRSTRVAVQDTTSEEFIMADTKNITKTVEYGFDFNSVEARAKPITIE